MNVLVSGGYAWVATVGGPALTLDPEWPPRASATAALACLVLGVVFSVRLGRWARPLTLAGFLGFTAGTWISLGDALDIARLEPVRAAFGGVGWMLFAFGWGAVREPRSVPEDAPNVIVGEVLLPRARPPALSILAIALTVVGALVPWALAWRVTRAEHAVLAHAVGLGCAVAMLAAGARISTLVGTDWHHDPPWSRVSSASASLGGLVLLGVLGLVLWVLRG
jgi:hypothetical protein